MKKILLITSTCILLLFSGCTTKALNKEFNEQAINGAEDSRSSSLTDKLASEQIIVDNKRIDLSTNKKLSTILSELGKIEDKVYHLRSKDIPIVSMQTHSSRLLNIGSFDDLKEYIENTSNYTIKIVKNKFVNGMKVVEVFDKESLTSNLINRSFVVKDKSSVSDALQEISKTTGFSVGYSHDMTPNSTSQNLNGITTDLKNILDSKKIYFNGDNVSKFLDYLSSTFDVFVIIDYKNKNIQISKYKTKIFTLVTPDYKIDVTDTGSSNTGSTTSRSSSASGSGSGGGSTGGDLISEKTVKNTITMNITAKFIESIKSLVDNDSGSKVLINESGMVIVKTTKANMDVVEDMFDEYNFLYTQEAEIDVKVYDFLLSKKFDAGVDLNYASGSTTMITNYVNNALIAVKKTGGGDSLSATVNLDNNFIRFSKSYSYSTVFTNNIPLSINLVQTTDYLKSLTNTTTSSTAVTTSTNTEIGTISEGQILTILPRFHGDKIFIKSEFKVNTLTTMDTTTVDNTVLSLPVLNSKVIPTTNVLAIGEKRLVGVYESFEDINNYKGIAPLEGFIIGGTNGKQFVRKAIAIVISINKK